jgi:Na+-driven multidrug efflux pump
MVYYYFSSMSCMDLQEGLVTVRSFNHFPGVITGCGKQKIGARVNLGAFYLVGIPTGVLLAFVFHLNGMVQCL